MKENNLTLNKKNLQVAAPDMKFSTQEEGVIYYMPNKSIEEICLLGLKLNDKMYTAIGFFQEDGTILVPTPEDEFHQAYNKKAMN